MGTTQWQHGSRLQMRPRAGPQLRFSGMQYVFMVLAYGWRKPLIRVFLSFFRRVIGRAGFQLCARLGFWALRGLDFERRLRRPRGLRDRFVLCVTRFWDLIPAQELARRLGGFDASERRASARVMGSQRKKKNKSIESLSG